MELEKSTEQFLTESEGRRRRGERVGVGSREEK
jgi:hypothetical protein